MSRGMMAACLIVLSGTVSVLTGCGSTTTPDTAVVLPPAADTPTTAPLYMGVPKAAIIAAVGTPTNPSGDLSGYGHCPTGTAVDMWKIGIDPTTQRMNYYAPRQGCGSESVPWGARADAVLPPDAVFMDQTTEPNGTILIRYHSGWLNLRVGCGTIGLGGDDATNVWVADLEC